MFLGINFELLSNCFIGPTRVVDKFQIWQGLAIRYY